MAPAGDIGYAAAYGNASALACRSVRSVAPRSSEQTVVHMLSRTIHRAALAALALLLTTASSLAQSTAPLRIATYNLLKYGGGDGDRTAALRTVVAAMRPHLIVSQEIESAGGVALFLNSVLDPTFEGRFEAAPFVDVSSDTEGAFFYDTTRVEYLGMEVIHTSLRGIFGYRFAVRDARDTVWIYTVHLKASDSEEDAARRAEEARHLRRHLDSARAGQNVIVAGDFNMYSGSEPAMSVLIGEGNNASARLVDPLNNSGAWHQNRDLAFLHTQSPRTRQFGGGVHGGLDDRFDLILVSTSLSPVINRASYTAFGNDGNHFNDSINRPPNNAVSQAVAQALHDGSDHLPVYADFHFGMSSVPHASMKLSVSVGPNPASQFVTFVLGRPSSGGTLEILDVNGVLIDRLEVRRGTTSTTWQCSAMPSGIYGWRLVTDEGRLGGKLVVAR